MSIYDSELDLYRFIKVGMANLKSFKEGAQVPDLQTCKNVAEKATKAACHHELGGQFVHRAEEVGSRDDALALLADILKALGEKPKSDSHDLQETFNVRQAAKRLGCSQRKLYDLVENQLIGHYRIGRAIRFMLEDLEEYQRTTQRQTDPSRVPALSFRHLS